MSATAPRRPLSELIGIPPIREVHAPAWFHRLPSWLSAGGILLVLVVVSGVLRTRQLNGELWFNEAIAVGIARHPVGQLWGVLRSGGSSPLYYLLLHFWIDAFGDSPADTHALSLLCGLLTIPAAMWAGWSLGGRRAGIFAAILFTFAGFITQYAEEVQPYTLLVLLSLLTTAGFVQGFVQRRRRWLWLFAAGLLAMAYTQASTGFYAFGAAVAVAFVVWWGAADRRRTLIDAAICFGAVIVLYIPWLPTTLHQIAHATSPYHYAPVVETAVPSQLLGGQRVDVTLLVALLVGLVPLLFARAQRRAPLTVAILALLVLSLFALLLALAVSPAWTSWIGRYFAELVAPLLILSALGASRARVVGVAAIVLCIAFQANPGSFASAHKSDMRAVAAQVGPLLRSGDVVAVAQPEQTPLAAYYLPSGLRWYSSIGPVTDTGAVNWSDAQRRLENAAPAAVLGPLVATLRPGQQLLFVRPLTEGVQNWKARWAMLVRRRAAQWGQLLTRDVANGTLTEVAVAPSSYPGACCVASSAVLYRKAR